MKAKAPDLGEALGNDPVVDPGAALLRRDQARLAREQLRWWLVVAAVLPMLALKSQAHTSSAFSSIDMIFTRAGSASALNMRASSIAASSLTLDDGVRARRRSPRGTPCPDRDLGLGSRPAWSWWRGHRLTYLRGQGYFENSRRNALMSLELMLR